MGTSKNMGSKDSQVSNNSRGNWGGTKLCGIEVEFMLSAIGYAVGIGNVWRFPYQAAGNGGGVFLIPYFIMLICCGIPIFFIELAFGQYSGQGPITIWAASPIFQGIGWAMVLVSALVSMYYNVVIAWSLFYLASSMQKILPWTRCDASWNKDPNPLACGWNISDPLVAYDPNKTYNSPAAEFWYYRALRFDQSEGVNDIGTPLWDLTLANFIAWLIVFFCLFKGVQSSGKVVYVTATFPYLVLLILFFFGIFQTGAGDGVTFYLTPEWSKLADASVWKAAATQIFYSLGVAFGGLMTMSSFNDFNNDVGRDTLIVCIGNCMTSFFAGFVIFSIIGHMAHEMDTTVEAVAGGAGPGLAFIAYPAALALLPVPQLFCVLFFLMMLALGLDSQYAMIEVVVTGITDKWPSLRQGRKKQYLLGFVCSAGFLLGIPITSSGGFYWFTLLDNYAHVLN